MAYKKRYERQCEDTSCKRRAIWEVFNWRNSGHGYYCTPHSDAMVAQLKRRE